MTRTDLINAAINTQQLIKQLRGVLHSVIENLEDRDGEEVWRLDALLTIAVLAHDQLESVTLASDKEPVARRNQ